MDGTTTPRRPAMLVPMCFNHPGRWSLDFAVRCGVRSDRVGLTGVRIENAHRVNTMGGGDCPSLADLVGEVQQAARYLTLLLQDGTTAREIEARLSPWAGDCTVDMLGQLRLSCGSVGAALVIAAAYAEQQLENSALPELMARGLLSEMG